MKRIFIDGQHGTVGLRLHSLIENSQHFEVATLPVDLAKDTQAKASLASTVDLAVLCLPSNQIENAIPCYQGKCKILDCSNIHRCNDEWVYGLPEMTEKQRELIRAADRVANPGCFASAFILLLRPLIKAGILDSIEFVTAQGITGYSAGGSRMIARFENDDTRDSAFVFNLTKDHKHIPEIMLHTGLNTQPLFCPVVSNYREGMYLSLSIPRNDLSIEEIKSIYTNRYADEKLVNLAEATPAHLDIGSALGNELEIYVSEKNNRVLLSSRMNNLGKGAAGVALQNINLMLGLEESLGL